MQGLFFIIFVFSFSGNTLTTVSKKNCDELQKVTQEVNSDVATKKAEIDRIKKLYAETDQETNSDERKHKQESDDYKKLRESLTPEQRASSKQLEAANFMVASRYENLVSSRSMLYHLHLKLIRLEENYKAAQQVQRAYRSERNVCRNF